MANTKSAKKRILQSQKRRQNNMRNRSIIRTFVKKVYLAISKNDKTKAMSAFTNMQSIVDHYSRKKLIHKNKASRYKSNLFKKIKLM